MSSCKEICTETNLSSSNTRVLVKNCHVNVSYTNLKICELYTNLNSDLIDKNHMLGLQI